MRTLIYKRTHTGDPDPHTGVFGNRDCMKTVRGRRFDAVIGIGGIGREPAVNGIAGKLTWVGIGARKIFGDPDLLFVTPKRPLVTFKHFRYFGEGGQLFAEIAPALAKRMYGKNVRVLMKGVSSEEQREVRRILRLAKNAPPSRLLKRGRRDADSKLLLGPKSGAERYLLNRSTKSRSSKSDKSGSPSACPRTRRNGRRRLACGGA
jgi:hypothetical protein